MRCKKKNKEKNQIPTNKKTRPWTSIGKSWIFVFSSCFLTFISLRFLRRNWRCSQRSMQLETIMMIVLLSRAQKFWLFKFWRSYQDLIYFPVFRKKLFGRKIFRKCVKLWAEVWIYLNMNRVFLKIFEYKKILNFSYKSVNPYFFLKYGVKIMQKLLKMVQEKLGCRLEPKQVGFVCSQGLKLTKTYHWMAEWLQLSCFLNSFNFFSKTEIISEIISRDPNSERLSMTSIIFERIPKSRRIAHPLRDSKRSRTVRSTTLNFHKLLNLF